MTEGSTAPRHFTGNLLTLFGRSRVAARLTAKSQQPVLPAVFTSAPKASAIRASISTLQQWTIPLMAGHQYQARSRTMRQQLLPSPTDFTFSRKDESCRRGIV